MKKKSTNLKPLDSVEELRNKLNRIKVEEAKALHKKINLEKKEYSLHNDLLNLRQKSVLQKESSVREKYRLMKEEEKKLKNLQNRLTYKQRRLLAKQHMLHILQKNLMNKDKEVKRLASELRRKERNIGAIKKNLERTNRQIFEMKKRIKKQLSEERRFYSISKRLLEKERSIHNNDILDIKKRQDAWKEIMNIEASIRGKENELDELKKHLAQEKVSGQFQSKIEQLQREVEEKTESLKKYKEKTKKEIEHMRKVIEDLSKRKTYSRVVMEEDGAEMQKGISKLDKYKALPSDIKKTLQTLNELLENLPQSSIKKFLKDPNFIIVKKVFEIYGVK